MPMNCNDVHVCFNLQKETLQEIKQNFQDTNQNKEPTKSIAGYYVYELLGSGAFGSVFKVMFAILLFMGPVLALLSLAISWQ